MEERVGEIKPENENSCERLGLGYFSRLVPSRRKRPFPFSSFYSN